MKYIILIDIGLVILFLVSIYLIAKTYNLIRIKKIKISIIGINIFFVSLFLFFILITSILIIYNYSYKKGLDLINQGNQFEAIEKLKTAVTIRSRLGKLTNVLDRNPFGLDLLFSTETNARMAIANSYVVLKDYQNANKEYQVIVSNDKNNYEAMAGVAETFFLLRDFAKSKQYYQRLIKIPMEVESFNYYFQIGKAYMVLLNYEKATNNFKRALEFKKNEEIVNHYLGICINEIKAEGLIKSNTIE